VGLDAVVYRNREHLEMGSDNARANMAQQTGEVYFEDNQLSRKYQYKVEAVAHRLGNVAEISALREEASGLIDPECFVIRKVLYSGTHSGDAIPLNELGELSAELHHIRQIDRTSPQMHQLVDELEDLIQAAKDEVNPIVCDIPLRCPRVNCAS